MKSFDQTVLRVCQPGVAGLSRSVRQAIRFAIALACMVAIILFLFFPPHAPWVVYPIPVAAAVFFVLTVFEAMLRMVTRFRRWRRLRRRSGGTMRTRRRYMAAKRLSGLAMAVLLFDVVFYDTYYGSPYGNLAIGGIQPIPIAVAALLLLIVINSSSAFGFFVCESDSEQLSRLQRQTYYSMLSAIDVGVCQPLTRNEVELEDEAELDDYHVIAFSAGAGTEEVWLPDDQDGWEDDIECDAAAIRRGAGSPGSSHGAAASGVARRFPR